MPWRSETLRKKVHLLTCPAKWMWAASTLHKQVICKSIYSYLSFFPGFCFSDLFNRPWIDFFHFCSVFLHDFLGDRYLPLVVLRFTNQEGRLSSLKAHLTKVQRIVRNNEWIWPNVGSVFWSFSPMISWINDVPFIFSRKSHLMSQC